MAVFTRVDRPGFSDSFIRFVFRADVPSGQVETEWSALAPDIQAWLIGEGLTHAQIMIHRQNVFFITESKNEDLALAFMLRFG